MISSSADGAISLVNSQAEAMFGYSREDLIGRNIRMLVSGLDGRFRPG